MKIEKKVILSLIVLTLFITIVLSNNVFASEIMNNIDRLQNQTATGHIVNSVSDIAGSVITIAQVICSGVAVAMLTILGIKYMSSAAGDKATIKKHAVVYVVGAIVMFSSTAILEIIQKFATSF